MNTCLDSIKVSGVSVQPALVRYDGFFAIHCNGYQQCLIFQIHTKLGLGQGFQVVAHQFPDTRNLTPETYGCDTTNLQSSIPALQPVAYGHRDDDDQAHDRIS